MYRKRTMGEKALTVNRKYNRWTEVLYQDDASNIHGSIERHHSPELPTSDILNGIPVKESQMSLNEVLPNKTVIWKGLIVIIDSWDWTKVLK